MRTAMFGLAIAFSVARSASAQSTPVEQIESAKVPLATALQNSAAALSGVNIPDATVFTTGDRTIAAGETAKGPVAVAGTLRIAGTIDGDAFAYGGDIVLLPGGHVTGNAVALNGSVQATDGQIDGDARSLKGDLRTVTAVAGAPPTVRENVALTLGWAGVVLVIGIGLLVFGGRTLDVVGETIDQRFGKSFLVGLGATLGLAPALALLIVGLALTILGVLLIPFAIVAYILAVVGVVALGFLAAVRVTGQSLSRSNKLNARGAALRALVIGVVSFLGLWLVAALATPWPAVEWVLRLIAFAATWAAATVGLGATIISRGGTRPIERSAENVSPLLQTPYERAALAVSPVPEWQTPTPVAGVVAARRRPSAAHKSE
jgi:hypothetical protein